MFPASSSRTLSQSCSYADVVTTTTHKTLIGPRGGLIHKENEELAQKLNSALFPDLKVVR